MIDLLSGIKVIIGFVIPIYVLGYSIVYAFFNDEDFEVIELIALRFVLGFFSIPLIVLILDQIWEVSKIPIITSLLFLYLFFFGIGLFLRKIGYYKPFKRKEIEKMTPGEEIIASSIMVAMLIGIIIVFGWIYLNPIPKEHYTEIYFDFKRIDLKNDYFEYEGYNGKVVRNNVMKVYMDLDKDGKMDDLVYTYEAPDTWAKTLKIGGENLHLSDATEKAVVFLKYPKEVQIGEDFFFSFVIVNHLGEDHNYQYVIEITDKFVSKGSVLIKNDEKKKINVKTKMPKTILERVKIGIILDTGEEIHFWANRV